MNGLEAIRQYKQATCPNCQYYYGNKCNNEYECFSTIVEKELKDFEELIEKYKVLRITKDKQYYALSTISDIIRDFNKGEFASAEIALQEITSILKEVL